MSSNAVAVCAAAGATSCMLPAMSSIAFALALAAGATSSIAPSNFSMLAVSMLFAAAPMPCKSVATSCNLPVSIVLMLASTCAMLADSSVNFALSGATPLSAVSNFINSAYSASIVACVAALTTFKLFKLCSACEVSITKVLTIGAAISR